MTRNYGIDWLKGLMILIIVLHHFFLFPHFRQTYLPVEFFFFVSGFYLMSHYSKHKGSAYEYTMGRLKSFYPAFILAFILACVVFNSRFHAHPLVETISSILLTITLSSQLFPHAQLIFLDVSWFFSSLIISGFVLYSILSFNERLATKVFFPLLFLLSYSILFSSGESLQDAQIEWMNPGLLRGIGGMSGGGLVYVFMNECDPVLNRHPILLNIAAILSFVSILFIMASPRILDALIVVLLPILLAGTLSSSSWINILFTKIKGGLLGRVGRYSFEILLLHQSIMVIIFRSLEVLHFHLPTIVTTVIIIVTTIAASILLRYSCNKIQLCFKHA